MSAFLEQIERNTKPYFNNEVSFMQHEEFPKFFLICLTQYTANNY